MRDKTFKHTEERTNAAGVKETVVVNRTDGIAIMGGAEIDNEESYLLAKMGRLLGTTFHENQTRICHGSTVSALAPSFGRGAMTNSYQDMQNAERISGITAVKIKQIAKTLCAKRPYSVVYALGMTQHSTGVQGIRAYAVMQLLLGNIGKTGGAINALRGEPNVQGSTDMANLVDNLPWYIPQPTSSESTLLEFCAKHGTAQQRPMVALLKAWFADNATAENDYCYDFIPRNNPANMPTYAQMFAKMGEQSTKCTGCIDRVENGLLPACAHTCQPGAIQFGKHDKIKAMAEGRLAELRLTNSKANLYGNQWMGGTTYLYLLQDRPDAYGLHPNPSIPIALYLWKDIIHPLGGIAIGASAAAITCGVIANFVRGNYANRAKNIAQSHDEGGK